VAIVGKYTQLEDAYKSIAEALTHGGMANRTRVRAEWIDAEIFEREDPAPWLENFHAILVPGGFGERGTEGKIKAATFARQKKIPYLGICLGMQMAVIEAARNLVRDEERRVRRVRPRGGREALYPCRLPPEGMGAGQPHRGAQAERCQGRHDAAGGLYREPQGRVGGCPHLRHHVIEERHRHRYEVDIQYRDQLEKCGLIFSGMSPDGKLPEIVEVKDHPWFIGVQFHPS
jgi:CTP synthase